MIIDRLEIEKQLSVVHLN